MRIVHSVHRYLPHVGGSEEVVRQLSERLAHRGHEVLVLTRGVAESPNKQVEIETVGGLLDYRRRLESVSRSADVLMVYGQKVWCSDWLPLAHVHCPVVYIPVGFDSWGKGPLHRLYYATWQRRVCNRADALVALTEEEETFLQQWLDHPMLTRIPNGVDFDYWQESSPNEVPSRGEFLLHVGGYYKNKRIDDLVRVTSDVQGRGFQIGLVNCGPDFGGNRRRVMRLADKRGLKGCFFMEVRTPGEVRSLYQNCAMYVSASTFEGFGLSYLEALACGKQVVCRPVGVAPELASRTENVKLANTNEELASQICALLEEGPRPEESKRVAREYDWDGITGQFETLYSTLAN